MTEWTIPKGRHYGNKGHLRLPSFWLSFKPITGLHLLAKFETFPLRDDNANPEAVEQVNKLYRIASLWGARHRSVGVGFRQSMYAEPQGIVVGLFVEGHGIGEGPFWHSLYEEPIITKPGSIIEMEVAFGNKYELRVWQDFQFLGQVHSPETDTRWIGVGQNSLPYYGGEFPADRDVKLQLAHLRER